VNLNGYAEAVVHGLTRPPVILWKKNPFAVISPVPQNRPLLTLYFFQNADIILEYITLKGR
jgi:hypothetical protein